MSGAKKRVGAFVVICATSAACGGGDAGDAPADDAAVHDATKSDADAPDAADAAVAPDATLSDAAAPTDDASAIDASDARDAADSAFGDGGVDLSAQDVTFFAFGDPQYGGGPYDKNTYNILALNAAADLVWPAGQGFAGEGATVGAPRGVIIAGDLTQNGQAGRDRFGGEWYVADKYAFDMNAQYGINVPNPDIRAELGLFLRDYGLRGNDGLDTPQLKWRVFEGYGNHDFDILQSSAILYGGAAPARDAVSIRHRVRAGWPEMRRFAAGNAGHYSWNWGATHFVHLNLVGADAPSPNGDSNSHFRDPQGALAFLRDDLAAEIGGTCHPVIISMHYGFDDFGQQPRWWDDAQRASFLSVIRPYNVVALLHGHTHETRQYTVSDGAKTYDVISLGSPYYEGQATNGGRGHFTVIHMKGNRFDAADVSWDPANPDPAEGDNKDLWTGKTLAGLQWQLTTTFAGGWGGWKLAKTIGADCSAPDAGAPDAGAPDAGAGDAGAPDAIGP